MVANIWKAPRKWECFYSILGQEGADPQTSRNFCEKVIQEPFLFGLETWVMTHSISQKLKGFHHRVAQSLAGIQLKQDKVGHWEYISMEKLMADVGLEEVEAYALCCHNTTDQYIATRKILELCMATEWQMGPWVKWR